MAACRRDTDVLVFTVFVGDTAALIGIALAALGIALSHLLNNPYFDPAASTLIGFVLIASAIVLARKSLSLLVGVSVDRDQLANLRNILVSDRAVPACPFEVSLHRMMTTGHLGEEVHPVVASAAREVLNKSDNERSGVLSTAMSFVGLYRDPTVADVTSRCDWRIADLISATHPVSLYLVVPPSDNLPIAVHSHASLATKQISHQD